MVAIQLFNSTRCGGKLNKFFNLGIIVIKYFGQPAGLLFALVQLAMLIIMKNMTTFSSPLIAVKEASITVKQGEYVV